MKYILALVNFLRERWQMFNRIEIVTENPHLPVYKYRVCIYTGSGVRKCYQSAHTAELAQQLAIKNYMLSLTSAIANSFENEGKKVFTVLVSGGAGLRKFLIQTDDKEDAKVSAKLQYVKQLKTKVDPA